MKNIWIFHLATLLLVATTVSADLEEMAAWRLLTFQPPVGYPGASPQGLPVTAPTFYFTGIESSHDRLFMAMPRFRDGLPACLGWVPQPPPGQRLPIDIPIRAFPDWDWHRAAAGGADSAATNCSALVNVYQTRLDACGRLWVLDSGVLNTQVKLTPPCPPKILIFNPSTGQLLRRVDFPSDVLQVNSILTSLVLDYRSPRSPAGPFCPDPDFVYISDTAAPAIIVYDFRISEAWRVTDPQMYPDPDHGIVTNRPYTLLDGVVQVAGETFKFIDGVIGLALSNPVLITSPKNHNVYTDRYLYFQAFTSDRVFSVLTSVLLSRPKEQDDLPIKLLGYKSSQGATLGVDPKDDSIIFNPIAETALVGWQPAQNRLTVKAYNPVLLQSVRDFVIKPDEIILISNRMQKFRLETVNANEVNLRILRIGTAQRALIKQKNMPTYFHKF